MEQRDFSPGSMWSIIPQRFEVLLRQFRDLQADAEILKEAAAYVPENIDGPSYQVVDGVAVIDIKGIVTKRMSFYAWLSGAAIVSRLIYEIEQAAMAPDIGAIVLDIDSPGGTVGGVDDVAAAVRKAVAQKTVIAYTGGMMASAAYWIGSAATEVVTGKTGELGSIGIFQVHEDWTKYDERVGIKTSIIKAGKFKAIHMESLTAEKRAVLQDGVDAVHDIFIESVSVGRGVGGEYVREQMADGRMYIGQGAVDLGFADRLGTLEEVISTATPKSEASFFSETAAGTMAAAQEKEFSMKFKNVSELEAAFPELVKEVREGAIKTVDIKTATESARLDGVDAGAKAECQRIKDVLAQSMPGHEDLVNELAFDGKTTGPVAAVQVLQAEKQVRGNAKEDLNADAIKPVVQLEPPTGEAAIDENSELPLDEQIKAEWDKSADLRTEFDGDFESYKAYATAMSKGSVKVLARK